MEVINAVRSYSYVLIFIMWVTRTVATKEENYPCGPRYSCKCVKDAMSINNITMDCSGEAFNSMSEICQSLGNVTRLDASNNDISGTIDVSGVDGCQNLTFLSLRNNSITNVEQSAFMLLFKLRSVDLSHNKLHVYARNSTLNFTHLIYLENLKINGNCIDPSDKQQRYPNLTENNKLASLYIDGLRNDDISFPTLNNLKILVFSGLDGTCYIEYIHDSYFATLPKLEILDMSYCNLNGISLHAFYFLHNLKRLDISTNRRLGMRPLFNVSYGLQFTQIEFLNYSYVYPTFAMATELKQLDICFLRNTTLQEIVLDGNRLQIIETNAPQLLPSTLQTVHLNDNLFTCGPYLLQAACLANLTNFLGGLQNSFHNPFSYANESLQGDQNHTVSCPFMEDYYLRNISNQTENCIFFDTNKTIKFRPPAFPKRLKKVIFNDNYMHFKLPRFPVIPLNNTFEYLDFSGNVFDDWEGPVGLVPRLLHLDLSRNFCTKIALKFFEYMHALNNLQIHSNFLGLSKNLTTNATIIFQNLTSLRILNMSFNQISFLPSNSFKSLYNLETLDLSYNNIDSWVLETGTLFNLTSVNLSNNALESLPTSFLKHHLEASRRRGTNFTIDLRNNPLMAGCKTRDFLFWVIKNKNVFVGFNEYVFVDDDKNTVAVNDLVTKLKNLRKTCPSKTLWYVLSSIGGSVVLSGIIFGLVYRNRWKLRYFMYMSKQRFYGYVRIPNEPPVENYRYDAFISYAEENLLFIKNQILPKIEKNGISLCIYQRDLLPGNAIADNIVDAIQSSRKTVVLLSKAFLKRKWCMYEFNMSRMENIYSRDGRGCLVMVLLENVPAKMMPPELIKWMKTEPYIEYTTDPDGERFFWSTLTDAITGQNRTE